MQHFKPMPNYAELRQRYAVDRASPSGLSRTQAARGKNGKIGPVLSKSTDGYYRVKIDGEHYRTQRVIYFLNSGIDPGQKVVDHIDGNILNNHPENLRACTTQENLWNAKGRAKRSGLPKGIEKLPNGMYRAYFTTGGVLRQAELANFKAAQHWLKSTRARCHGEFARAEA
ncbi:HNH endonuclease [Pseudomonas huanghezhanensis]|uniref:HNH endonuclease n=1 Tax=Pseudomonas huanghezhanensis TaxID=3002903 RepID=UPI0022855E2F|nr:HNH endonuclease [Pseudomonas sp. BSw22131]